MNGNTNALYRTILDRYLNIKLFTIFCYILFIHHWYFLICKLLYLEHAIR